MPYPTDMLGATTCRPGDVEEAAQRVSDRDAAWETGDRDYGLYPAAASPCACGKGRGYHGGDQHRGGIPGSRCRKYRPDPIERLIETAFAVRDNGFAEDLRLHDALTRPPAPERKPGEWRVRSSDVGACARAIGYRNLPALTEFHGPGSEFARMLAEYQPAPTDWRPARMGTLIHDGWQSAQRALYPWRRHEVSLPAAGLYSQVRYDSYDPVVGDLISGKTAGGWRWEQVTDRGIAESWLDQAAIEGVAIEADGGRVTRVKIVVIQRADGKDVAFTYPWDDRMRDRAERARARLVGIINQFDWGIMPEREGAGPTEDGICRNCAARRHCWNMDDAERRSMSPEARTILGLDPDEAAVEWAIISCVEAMRAFNAAETTKKQAYATLDGLPTATYGRGQLVPGRKPNPDYKRYSEMLREEVLAAAAEGRTPDIDSIPMPRQKQPRPTARLLPAATLQRIEQTLENRPVPDPPPTVAVEPPTVELATVEGVPA